MANFFITDFLEVRLLLGRDEDKDRTVLSGKRYPLVDVWEQVTVRSPMITEDNFFSSLEGRPVLTKVW